MKSYLILTTPLGTFEGIVKEDTTQEDIDKAKSMIEHPNIKSLWLPTSNGFAYFPREILLQSVIELKIFD